MSIEGDQQTTNDADRIRATGAPPIRSTPARAVIWTVTWSVTRWSGSGPERRRLCHRKRRKLVCPAAFDLGEAHKVAILSVTEGEDKPLKYPDMFAASDVMVLNKTTCCRISISMSRIAIANARKVNPDDQGAQGLGAHRRGS
jgi:hydrogenase nickel incorporation protein HypB